MKVRGAVLREMGRPKPYADSAPLEIVELELAPPGPGELLVRVGAAGLCHSDLSVIDGSRPRVMPMVLGHEAAGEVVASGGDTPGFATGDHVVLSFVPTCGDCGPCRAGRGQAAALKPRLPPLIRGFQLCVESATSGAQPSGRALISPFVWLRREPPSLE